MNQNAIILLKTHTLNDLVFNEYKKLCRTGKRVVLYVDNRQNLFAYSPDRTIHAKEKGVDIEACLTYQKDYEALMLPCYVKEGLSKDFSSVLWYNHDYQLYVARKLFPEYQFYWQIEYDVYYNGDDYRDFFGSLDQDYHDLITLRLGPATQSWFWNKNVDWVYKNITKYYSFEVAMRVSAQLIDFLYYRRLSQAIQFKHVSPRFRPAWWAFCELFVPTEAVNNNFTYTIINNHRCMYDPKGHPQFLPEKLYLKKDNLLYHPVKDPAFLSELV